jgi:hypothetical protein
LASESFTGDDNHIKGVAKQALNKTSAQHLISRQECMVLLGDLDLVLCSETIENVSMSNSTEIVATRSTKKPLLSSYIHSDQKKLTN